MITTRNNTVFKYQTTLVDNREDKNQSYTTMTQIVLKVTESTKNSSLLVSEFPIFYIKNTSNLWNRTFCAWEDTR